MNLLQIPVVNTLKMLSIENKVAIVTGAANGIGANIVLEFLKKNIKYVAIIDIDVASGIKLQEEIHLKYGKNKATFFNCDITQDDHLQNVFSRVIEEHDSIDLVVNNAGIADDSPQMYKKTIDINFRALVTTTLMALDHMRVDKGGKGGTIINISSIAALDPNILAVHIYSATKRAVLEFSTRLGMDPQYSRTAVRVMTVCFGATDTKIMKECTGFDKETNEEMTLLLKAFETKSLIQCPAVAARSVVHIYEKGTSASIWLTQNDETIDITDNLKQANAKIRDIIKF